MEARDVIREMHRLARNITSSQNGFDLRRRLNPHHTQKDQNRERKEFIKMQHGLFLRIKTMYTEHREELYKLDLTQDDREMLEALEACVVHDLEKEF